MLCSRIQRSLIGLIGRDEDGLDIRAVFRGVGSIQLSEGNADGTGDIFPFLGEDGGGVGCEACVETFAFC